jgi:hypothetical protein
MQHSLFFPLLLAALAASGCAATPNLDRQFGHSVAQLRQRQMLSPQAGANRDPVAGLDGKAAQAAYAAYQKSFAAPAPQAAAFTIGVGARK